MVDTHVIKVKYLPFFGIFTDKLTTYPPPVTIEKNNIFFYPQRLDAFTSLLSCKGHCYKFFFYANLSWQNLSLTAVILMLPYLKKLKPVKNWMLNFNLQWGKGRYQHAISWTAYESWMLFQDLWWSVHIDDRQVLFSSARSESQFKFFCTLFLKLFNVNNAWYRSSILDL